MKIFITYSRSDQQQVASLVKDLEELGHDLWFDQDLSGGQSWWDNILLKIRECEVYIFSLTPEALDSTACLRELKYAEALRKNCLPVLLKPGVSMAMAPRYISLMQFINYTNPGDKTAVFALIKAIGKLPPVQSMPEPLPVPPDVPISYLDTIKEKIDAPSLDKRDQIELLNDLKSRMNDPDTKKEDVVLLLKKLRRHDDLLASISTEIDTVLNHTASNHTSQTQTVKQTVQGNDINKSATAYTHPVPQNQPHARIPDSSAGVVKKAGWETGTMAMLIIGALIIPILGIIFGIIGLSAGGNKKNQGIILLIIGVLSLIYWINRLNEAMNYSSQFYQY